MISTSPVPDSAPSQMTSNDSFFIKEFCYTSISQNHLQRRCLTVGDRATIAAIFLQYWFSLL
ncbi:hypothetical protein NC653_004320 [Populus alba x Populus x berolinensis]|uniref:Uncharacterized protein n=1 Tax=Populus alba x Populus x berolinensis TaxID=444605 RepID=A0AAD6RTS2_9ROSI|nr:hypothetical protein NC653_004320 [Populus alba x Populus x berolinensis]